MDAERLISGYFYEALTDEEFQQFHAWLQADPSHAESFIVKTYDHYCLREYFSASTLQKVTAESPLDQDLFSDAMSDTSVLEALLEVERNSPGIASVEIPPVSISEGLKKKAVITSKPANPKLWIFTALLALAAIVLVLLIPLMTYHPVEVAILSDAMDVVWAEKSKAPVVGSVFMSDRYIYSIGAGIIDLHFNAGPNALIEGPAQFSFSGANEISLWHGRIYSKVPSEGIGFTVVTPSTRIVDLGTEFGVQVDQGGLSQVHMIRGTASLRPIAKGLSNKQVLIETDQALQVTGNFTLKGIPLQSQSFVRSISSKQEFVWRGEDLNLAGIVAGCDGFQKIDSLCAWDPGNGMFATSVTSQYRRADRDYHLVQDSNFIDGVFVPDGEFGAIQISSVGHTFDCPDTLGEYTHEISAYQGPLDTQQTTIPPVSIDGQEVVDAPIIMIHSNAGITIDLQRIRESLSSLVLTHFKAIGIPVQKYKPNLDFWILVDGELKYERRLTTADRDRRPIAIELELTPQDRFLTLVVTNGLPQSYAYDFFYLVTPQLGLKERLKTKRISSPTY